MVAIDMIWKNVRKGVQNLVSRDSNSKSQEQAASTWSGKNTLRLHQNRFQKMKLLTQFICHLNDWRHHSDQPGLSMIPCLIGSSINKDPLDRQHTRVGPGLAHIYISSIAHTYIQLYVYVFISIYLFVDSNTVYTNASQIHTYLHQHLHL